MKMSFYPILFLSLVTAACAVKTVNRNPDAAPAAQSEEAAPQAPIAAIESPVAEAQAPAVIEHSSPTPVSQAVAPQPEAPMTAIKKIATKHPAKNAVPWEKSLGWLKNGNTRFVKMSLRKDGQSKKDIQRLAKGQAPHAIVLSCSDSQAPAEIVFDQKLGEIFVVRNAGNVADTASIASIEYAVEQLGTQLLVVMGHTSCGAVKTALNTLDGSDAGTPALNALVHDIHPRISQFHGRHPASAHIEKESWANTNGVARDLLERSALLREKVASGELKIQPALYHLENGKVDFAQ